MFGDLGTSSVRVDHPAPRTAAQRVGDERCWHAGGM